MVVHLDVNSFSEIEVIFLFLPEYFVMYHFLSKSIHVGEFDDVLDSGSSKSSEDSLKEIQLSYDNVKKLTLPEVNGSMPLDDNEKLLVIENLTVQTPTKSVLVKDLSLQINEKDHLLVRNLLNEV